MADTSSSQAILNVQAQLRQRGYKVDSLTGVLDTQTMAAIRTFQSDNGLPMTGQIDQQLVALLSQGGTMPQGGGTPTGQGSAGNGNMLALEQGLAALGYNPGAVDGVYDATTKAAIKKFQTDYDMTPVNGHAPSCSRAVTAARARFASTPVTMPIDRSRSSQ